VPSHSTHLNGAIADRTFDFSVTNRFAPEIEGYCDILLNRIAPIFEDGDGEGQRAMDAFIKSAAKHARDEDYDDVVEAAYDHAQAAELQFLEMRGVFLATGVSGLFHLFERQLYLHVNKELKRWLTKPIALWRDLEDLIPHFNRLQFGDPAACRVKPLPQRQDQRILLGVAQLAEVGHYGHAKLESSRP
jgi:hypothetical protein